jgi:DNA-binding transcriptional MerR regulator/methylmalonyl-CoA mutase cobalamin-binding subunit
LSKYRIQTVAQLTGLTPSVIRAWESRYQLVVPARTEAGYRIYDDEDVALLRGAQKLISEGMAPMQVARLPRGQVLGRACPERVPAPSYPEPESEAQGPPMAPSTCLFTPQITEIIEAFANFDSDRVEKLLGPLMTALTPHAACHSFLLPLLRELGDRWHAGRLSVAAEHFGTCIVRSKLLAALEALRERTGPHKVVCACPPGEFHEIGLLMFALFAASQGFRPVYLGVNLPLSDMLDAVVHTRPEILGLSIVTRHEPDTLRRLLVQIHDVIGKRALLLVGGQGVAGLEDLVRESGCVTLPASGHLDELLAAEKDAKAEASPMANPTIRG